MVTCRTLAIGFVILLLQGSTRAQPFSVDGSGEWYYLSGTAVCALGGYLYANSIASPSLSEITLIKRDDINRFDRPAADHYSPASAALSDVLLLTAATAPGLLLFDSGIRDGKWTVPAMYAESMLLTVSITTIVKAATQRYRPFIYNDRAPIEMKLDPDARQSFFSGHTSVTFAAASFVSSVYAAYNPDSRMKPYITLGMYGIAAVTAYLRYDAGKHFPTDILTGAVVGTAIGYFVPKLHENGGAKKIPSSAGFNASVPVISLRWGF
jgi:membrane-associated phospholipid phosphatase